MNYALRNIIIVLFSISTGMLCAMDSNTIPKYRNKNIYDYNKNTKDGEKIFNLALQNDDLDAIKDLINDMKNHFGTDKYGAYDDEKFRNYQSFVLEAAAYDKENIFKFLLTEDPFKCLNKPKHDGNYSEPYTIYDTLNNSFYLSEKTREKYMPIAASYGAKSVKQLQKEGVSSAFPVQRYHGSFGGYEIND